MLRVMRVFAGIAATYVWEMAVQFTGYGLKQYPPNPALPAV